MDFDVVPFEDITWGGRIGGGSFGSVFKGQYLGIDIAIKEVHASTEYDVHKYFEREWRILRECRHPNISLFLGLSREPGDDGRVFIVSEYVPNGNLRRFIRSGAPFPWRLRLSYAADTARAVAYLHARQCMHRDLKGENLLITNDDRIKVADFGFARITSRNVEEMRHMTYCGTDGYMAPEVIMGEQFDLPADVFSLGIIFLEILTRVLSGAKVYTRRAPIFVPDADIVRQRASPGCPEAFIELALDCCRFDPCNRPTMTEVLERLQAIQKALPLYDMDSIGCMRMVKRDSKRAIPIFVRPDSPPPAVVGVVGSIEDEAVSTFTDQADSQALDVLVTADIKIDGSGATPIPSVIPTIITLDGSWTGQTDAALSSYTIASEMLGEPLMGPSHAYPSSGIFERGAVKKLKSGTEDVTPRASLSGVRHTLGSGIAIVTNTAARPRLEESGAGSGGSTRTVKDGYEPTPTVSPAITPPLTSPKRTITPPNVPSPKRAKPEPSKLPPAPPPRLDPTQPPSTAGHGHRFTLAPRDASNKRLPLGLGASLANLPFTFFPFSGAAKDKNACAVCARRLGANAVLRCGDCAVAVHPACSARVLPKCFS